MKNQEHPSPIWLCLKNAQFDRKYKWITFMIKGIFQSCQIIPQHTNNLASFDTLMGICILFQMFWSWNVTLCSELWK